MVLIVVGRSTVVLPQPPPKVVTHLNRPLPAYQLTNLEQRELNADELRSGRILLVYLTTGCASCIKEAEIISRLRQKVPPDLHIYGVAIESPTQLMLFAKEHNLLFPLLLDTGGQLTRSLDTKYFPSKYLIEDGIITKAWYGKTRDEDELRSQLEIK